jgi:hypothetical protein
MITNVVTSQFFKENSDSKYGHILRGKILNSPYLGDMGFRRSPNYRRVQKVFYSSLWTTNPNLQLIPLLDDHLCG